MNKPKAQGTRFETWLVNYFNDKWTGLYAARLPELGLHDQGDIHLESRHTDTWTVEAKARANLNPHLALHKAKQKADTTNVAVIWKRLTRKQGNTRRTPTGEPIIVILDLDTYTRLITR